MANLEIKKSIYIKAPPEHVWKFLTEKEKLAVWFHEGEQDLRDGGPYAVVTNSPGKEGTRLCWGEVLKFDPPLELVHSFTHKGLGEVETICRWTLTAVAGGTLLSLHHTGFGDVADGFQEVTDHDVGWDEHFVRLRKVAH